MIMEGAKETSAIFMLYTNMLPWFAGQCDMMSEEEKEKNKCMEVLDTDEGDSHLLAYYGI